ncbi:MAG: L,D-transpeptidase family protein [Patescibacteria group bacterium]
MRYILFLFIFILIPQYSIAQNTVLDSDNDGLTDWEEEYKYFTDKENPDTDGDGYLDGIELQYHYSPHQAQVTLSGADQDQDGLSDWLELQFGTNWLSSDTDGDGYPDYAEVVHSYDPLSPEPRLLDQSIIIDTDTQKVRAYLDGVQLTEFDTSTGKLGYETPPGVYKIENKHPRAWSGSYGLWMPYWMGFIGTTYGIHELPEWPGGYKEGEDHLGTPVSHGCVRLGEGDAEWLYTWARIGTTVEVR